MSKGGSKLTHNVEPDVLSGEGVNERSAFPGDLSPEQQKEFQKLLSGDLSDVLSGEVNKQNSYLGGLSPEEQEEFQKLLSGESSFAFEGGVAK